MFKCTKKIFIFIIPFFSFLEAMQQIKSAFSHMKTQFSTAAQSPAKNIAHRFLHNHASRITLGTMGIGATKNSKDSQALSPSQACEQGPISRIKTVADLKKEAAINIRTGQCKLGCTRFVGTPSSLQRALNNLNDEQIEAINKYHAANTENMSVDIKSSLLRNVELLIRDDEERIEILDNLRWLQKDGEIGYVSKVTPNSNKHLPFLAFFAPITMFPSMISTILAGIPAILYGKISIADKLIAKKLRTKYKDQNKFKDHKGII